MRFRPPEEAWVLRRRHAGSVFAAGLFIAGFVSIPILNLATPLFGTALMVHMHKRLSAREGVSDVSGVMNFDLVGPAAKVIDQTRPT